jgi:ADP-ribose pyrophosphatase
MARDLTGRDYIYEGKIVALSLSRFRTPEGGDVTIEVVHHSGGAGALPLFDDGTLALVRQWRYPINKYSLEIPAGRIERGHGPEETAARELEEELGYRAGELRKISEFNVAPGYCEERVYVYLATGLVESAQNLDEDEEIEVVRMTFDEALRMVESGEIDDAKTVVALLRAYALLKS